jgi:hypothetical protein
LRCRLHQDKLVLVHVHGKDEIGQEASQRVAQFREYCSKNKIQVLAMMLCAHALYMRA